jgi:AcrR family transcriptional regulator
LSPAAMYVHFPSKEAILMEIARTAHEKASTP